LRRTSIANGEKTSKGGVQEEAPQFMKSVRPGGLSTTKDALHMKLLDGPAYKGKPKGRLEGEKGSAPRPSRATGTSGWGTGEKNALRIPRREGKKGDRTHPTGETNTKNAIFSRSGKMDSHRTDNTIFPLNQRGKPHALKDLVQKDLICRTPGRKSDRVADKKRERSSVMSGRRHAIFKDFSYTRLLGKTIGGKRDTTMKVQIKVGGRGTQPCHHVQAWVKHTLEIRVNSL